MFSSYVDDYPDVIAYTNDCPVCDWLKSDRSSS